jgi:anti-sigma B factor antagonist
MSRTHILNISVRVLDRMNTVVDLDGAIDLSNSHGLRTKLFERLAATPRLVLNMSGIRYIDSAGIATLVEVVQQARVLQKDFVLFGVGTTVRDVLRLTNMLGVFQVFDTEEHALAGQ